MERQPLGLSPSISLIAASVFWAAGTVISKEVLGAVSPILFLVIQLVPSVLVLWLIVMAKGILPSSRRGLLPIVLLGWLNPGLSYTLSMLGLTRTTASVATLLWAVEPALIIVTAWLLLREAVTARLVFLTAAAALGVILASGSASLDNLATENGYGAGLILGGVLCCALYTVWSRRIVPETDALFIVAVQQTIGLMWVAAIWPLELQGNAIDQILALSSSDLTGGVVSGLMYYALAYWLYLNGLRSMPASRAGNFLNLIPMFGIAFAHMFLGERLTAIQWVGAATILLSVFTLQAWAAPSKVSQGSA